MLCPDLQAEDLEKLALAGCAAVFMPTASLYHPGGTTTTSTDGGAGNAGAHVDASMVVGAQGEAADPEAHETWVTVEHLSQGLCAKSRPHFFRGVCTVSWAVQWRGWGGCAERGLGALARLRSGACSCATAARPVLPASLASTLLVCACGVPPPPPHTHTTHTHTPHTHSLMHQVVTKLFHIVEPDAAYFGKKDYQQWRVIQRMVRDLDMALEVVGMPILREGDGLAMSRCGAVRGVFGWRVAGGGGGDGKQRGLVVRVWACLRCPIPHCRCRSCPRCCSRNALLTPEDRRRCVCISQGLAEARQAAEAGTATAAQQLQRLVADWVSGGGGRVDYVEVVNAHTLRPVAGDVRGQLVLIAVAALFGKVRLIDNVEVEVGAAVAATI